MGAYPQVKPGAQSINERYHHQYSPEKTRTIQKQRQTVCGEDGGQDPVDETNNEDNEMMNDDNQIRVGSTIVEFMSWELIPK